MALIKDVDRGVIRREWRIISMVFAQLLLLALIVVQVLQILGLHINVSLRIFEIKPVFDPADIIVLVMSIIVLAILSYLGYAPYLKGNNLLTLRKKDNVYLSIP